MFNENYSLLYIRKYYQDRILLEVPQLLISTFLGLNFKRLVKFVLVSSNFELYNSFIILDNFIRISNEDF